MEGTAASVAVRVPAKINLFLAVRGRRADGYHELATVLQTVSLHDTVTASLEGSVSAVHPASRRFMEVAFSTDAPPEVPAGEDNLVVRAARALMAAGGIGAAGSGGVDGPLTRLHLTKQIPVAGGMAGGSANAAATLVALNELWRMELSGRELRELAAGIGSDVPFCVGGGTALATGTGVATAQVLTRGVYHWVVGVTDKPLATPDVYRAYDEVADGSDVEPDAVLQALSTGDHEALGAALHNDLEVAACALLPTLVERRQALLDAGALGAIVSGSGPTLVALASSARHAVAIAARVRGRFDRVEIAQSPAGGPELLA